MFFGRVLAGAFMANSRKRASPVAYLAAHLLRELDELPRLQVPEGGLAGLGPPARRATENYLQRLQVHCSILI